MENKEFFMGEALREAGRAADIGEVPVGAVVVKDGEIIARAHNMVESYRSSSAHAEMLAMQRAEDALSSKWLLDCDIYVTLEPCAMCAGAMVLSRAKRLYIGAMDPKNGAVGSVMNVAENNSLNHVLEVERGIMAEECGEVLTRFFRDMRINRSLESGRGDTGYAGTDEGGAKNIDGSTRSSRDNSMVSGAGYDKGVDSDDDI